MQIKLPPAGNAFPTWRKLNSHPVQKPDPVPAFFWPYKSSATPRHSALFREIRQGRKAYAFRDLRNLDFRAFQQMGGASEAQRNLVFQRRHAVVCLHSRARQFADSYGGMSNLPLGVNDKNP